MQLQTQTNAPWRALVRAQKYKVFATEREVKTKQRGKYNKRKQLAEKGKEATSATN